MVNKKLQGKQNREAGQRFERKIRADLEKKGWVCDRWNNNVEFWKEKIKGKKELIYDWEENSLPFGKLVPAKSRFNMRTNCFPDFVAFKTIPYRLENYRYVYEVIGVECKSNGYLTKEEKLKCDWLLDNKIFSKILIVKKGKKRGEIIYKEYEKR